MDLLFLKNVCSENEEVKVDALPHDSSLPVSDSSCQTVCIYNRLCMSGLKAAHTDSICDLLTPLEPRSEVLF